MGEAIQITRNDALFVIVDIQEKLARQMPDQENVIKNTEKLLKAAQRLQIPFIFTEQYPDGLGKTIPELEQFQSNVEPIDKMTFCCCGEERFLNALSIENRNNILIIGMEAHICVMQTGLDLMNRGYMVGVVQDAVCSFKHNDKEIALNHLHDSGALIVTTEMILYELLVKAGTDDFKDLLPILKDRS